MSRQTDRHGNHDEQARRDRALQDRKREEMNSLVRQVEALSADAFDEMVGRVGRRREAAKDAGDPMKLQATGKKRKERRAQQNERQALQRKAENLTNLFNRKTIDAKMLRAAVEIRDLMLIVTGGMQAMDWIRERVDGGKLATDMIGGGAYAAECELRNVIRKSGMGDLAAEVVLRVAGMDESVKAVAIDLERRPKAGQPVQRDTQAFAVGLLCEGLRAAYRVLFPENQSDEKERAYRLLIRAWTSGDATSDRPDIRANDPRFKEAG